MAHRSLPILGALNPRSIHEATSRSLTPDLRRPVPRARAVEAATLAEDWSDELTAGVAVAVPPDRPVACRAGCAHCCRLKVIVTAPEAIRVVEALRARLDDAQLAAVRARVAATDDATHGMTVDQRIEARIACPLLVDELCSAHDVRPLACRGSNSYDSEVCRLSLEEPNVERVFEFYRPQVGVNEALRAGVSVASTTNGLDGTLLELNAALRVLLSRPSVADDWGKGQRDALTIARDAEFEKLVRRARK